MNAPILRLSGVHTSVAGYQILHGIDLEVAKGEVVMLLGRNGVGKTSTLKTIIGEWPLQDGEITFSGTDISDMPSWARARLNIGYVPEDMGIFSDLTVRENMELAAVSGPLDERRLEWIFSAFPAIRTFWNGRAGTLSGGQKQMLSIARAIAEPRDLYLIDEPTKGLAPSIVQTMTKALQEIKESGASILMVEQNLSVAFDIGDRAVVADDGKCVWSGDMSAFKQDRALQARFIGLDLR